MPIEKTAYHRLETDAEFLKRLPWHPYSYQKLEGDYLDYCAWEVFKMQRRLILVYP